MSEQPSRGSNPELEKLIAERQSPQQIRDTVHNYWEKLGVKSDPAGQGLMWPEADLDKGERIARENKS